MKSKIRFQEKKLLRAGLRIIDLINQNIKNQVDYEGHPLAKYSAGYAEMKERKYPQHGGKVNLSVTGLMLAALDVVGVSDNQIVIGFDDPEQAQKAYWHTISGAGRSRVLRQFMGLSREQWEDKRLVRLINESVDVVISD